MATDKMWEPGMAVPQDEDGASVTRTPKKREKIKYEEPGSAIKVEKMAKGGSASSRADGCCVKGKTRGKYL